MKILLATSTKQFHHREIEIETLRDQLQALGALTDILVLPFSMNKQHLLSQLSSYRMLDVRHVGDCLVSMSAPTHILRHPNKVVVFSDSSTQLVDTWDEQDGYLDRQPMHAIRKLLYRAEQVGIQEAALGVCFSNLTARRMQTMVRCVVTDSVHLAAQLAGKHLKSSRLSGKKVA